MTIFNQFYLFFAPIEFQRKHCSPASILYFQRTILSHRRLIKRKRNCKSERGLLTINSFVYCILPWRSCDRKTMMAVYFCSAICCRVHVEVATKRINFSLLHYRLGIGANNNHISAVGLRRSCRVYDLLYRFERN